MAEPIISAVEPIFTYENIKNNQKIRDQWIDYILQKSKDKRRQLLLTQFLGSNTLQINKLTPESFDTINKILGAPAINDKTDKPVVVTDGQPSNGNPNQQPQKADNKNKPGEKPGMSDDEIDAFLKEELGGNNTGGGTPSTQGTQTSGTGSSGTGTGGTGGMRTGGYASAGVPKGGTKTIGFDDPYDPNPGHVSLAYDMRNASEQERRDALIDEWNKEHGISYVTGKDGVIYRIDPQHPNGIVDPFKNDLSTWTRATRSGSTYASPGISTGGTYATGEGIKDANGNVLTNPGGGVDYQYALKHPEYGLVIRGRMSEPQKDYLQAVSNNMGYNYNF